MGRSTSTCEGPTTGRAAGCCPRSSKDLVLPVLERLEHDPLRLHGHLQRSGVGPVLLVDGVVLDGRIEPEAVAVVLAVVEGRLQRTLLPAPAAAPAAAPPAPPAALLLVLLLAGGFILG